MVALDHPVYTCAYVEKERAEEEGREQNETWKGYVRTATIRADQEPVGALVRISNSMNFFFVNINIK